MNKKLPAEYLSPFGWFMKVYLLVLGKVKVSDFRIHVIVLAFSKQYCLDS